MLYLFLSILIISIIFYFCNRYKYENFTTRILYNGDEWNHYRIGDLYSFNKFVGCSSKNPQCRYDDYHNFNFPNSIAHYYTMYNPKNTPKNRDAMLLAIKVVNSRTYTETTECCLHIRVGDVINMGDDSALKYSRKNDTIWWNNVLVWLRSKQIKNIVIMAGSHTKDDERKSLEYINDRKQFLENNGFNISLRLGNSPDQDILTAFNSKYFISTGGTYGKLMKELSSLNNVIVYDL